MEKKVNIVSTKKLDSFYLEELVPIANVVDFDILELKPIVPEKSTFFPNIVFTSYKATLRGLEILGKTARDYHFYCVGKKSEQHLKDLRLEVYGFANYSKDLAELLVQNIPNSSFTYLCSENRLDELPQILKENNIAFEEVYTYTTEVSAQIPEADQDIYMWYSPMGVRSYKGEVKDGALHICIGETTKREVANRFPNEEVICPSTPVMDELIALTRKKAIEINLNKCTETVTNNNDNND